MNSKKFFTHFLTAILITSCFAGGAWAMEEGGMPKINDTEQEKAEDYRYKAQQFRFNNTNLNFRMEAPKTPMKPEEEGKQVAIAWGARDLEYDKQKIENFWKHPKTHFQSLTIQTIDRGFVSFGDTTGGILGKYAGELLVNRLVSFYYWLRPSDEHKLTKNTSEINRLNTQFAESIAMNDVETATLCYAGLQKKQKERKKIISKMNNFDELDPKEIAQAKQWVEQNKDALQQLVQQQATESQNA